MVEDALLYNPVLRLSKKIHLIFQHSALTDAYLLHAVDLVSVLLFNTAHAYFH